MSKNKSKKKTKISNSAAIFFQVLAVLLLIYMLYTLYTTYTGLSSQLEQNNTSFAAEWSTCIQVFLASIVPCLVYAFTCYGIGIIIKNQQQIIDKD